MFGFPVMFVHRPQYVPSTDDAQQFVVANDRQVTITVTDEDGRRCERSFYRMNRMIVRPVCGGLGLP